MSKSQKKSIQELVLGFLQGKRAQKKQDMFDEIECLMENEDSKTKPRYAISRTLKTLINDGMVEHHETERSSFMSLTATGRQKLRNIKLNSQNHLISTTWDGYWRIVIIDIPETRKKERDAIRYILKKAQFIALKNSVWISPHPLEHMMINMKTDLGLTDEMIVMVTDRLDPATESMLVNKFGTTE